MYYKVLKTSPTGLKLTEIFFRGKDANNAAQKLIESFGASQFRPGYWAVAGGVSSILFPEGKPEKSELKHWKIGARKGEYLPAERTKIGKAMCTQIEALPRVLREELNSIVGYQNDWNSIGLNWCKDGDYYLIDLMEDWDVHPPADCIEITRSEWKTLNGKKESEVENG